MQSSNSRESEPAIKTKEEIMKMRDNDNLLIGIIIAVAVFLFSGMFGFGGMMGGYGMMGGFGFGSMWIFGFLFMTLILVALILFILWLIKQLQEDKKKR